MEKVVLLEGAGLMPTLLPVVMGSSDTLQLTDEQVSAFRAWRRKHCTRMVNLMNEVIEKMVQFRVDALSPDVCAERLLACQSEAHELQRKLPKVKLSCRELVMTTFTDEQRVNFAFVVSDSSGLACLLLEGGR